MQIDRAGNRPDVWYRTEDGDDSATWVRLGGNALVVRADEFDSGAEPGHIDHSACLTLSEARKTWPQRKGLWDAICAEYEAIEEASEKGYRDHARFFCEPY